MLERGRAVAGHQEPQWREQARGPQHEVNPAASSEKQWESRAAHVTVKATSAARRSGNGAAGLPGVWGTARAHGSMRNRRDVCPGSRDGLAGESPATVMAKQPCSGWPAEGETRPSKRHDKVPSGGERACGPYVEESQRSVVKFRPREREACGSRASVSRVKAMEGARNLEQHRWTRRRSGSGTHAQPIAKQERSVSVPAQLVASCQLAAPGKDDPHKPRGEAGECRAEVGGGHW